MKAEVFEMDTELAVSLLLVLAVVILASVSAGLAMRKNTRRQYTDPQQFSPQGNIGQWGRDAEQDPYAWQPPAPAPLRKPYLKKALPAAAAAFILLAVITAVMHIRNDEIGGTEPQAPAPTAQPSHSPAENQPSHPKTESAASEELVFTVDKMMFARHNGNLKYMEMAGAGLLNCCVYVSAENPNAEAVSLTDYGVFLTCDGIRYEQFLSDDPAFLFAHRFVAPGETLKLKVIDFQIPAEQQYAATSVELTVISPGGQETTWTLR